MSTIYDPSLTARQVSVATTWTLSRAGLGNHGFGGNSEACQPALAKVDETTWTSIEGLLEFDTADMVAEDVLGAALVWEGDGVFDVSPDAYALEFRVYNWGTFDENGFVPGDDIAALPLVASVDYTPTNFPHSTPVVLASGAGLIAGLNPGGLTRWLLALDGLRLDVAPTAFGAYSSLDYVGNLQPGFQLVIYTNKFAAEGNQPAPSGSLTFDFLLRHVSAEGNQPAPSGTLTFEGLLLHSRSQGATPHGSVRTSSTAPRPGKGTARLRP